MPLTRRNLLLGVTVVLLGLLVTGVPASGRSRATPPHGKRMLWGAWIGAQFTKSYAPWDWRPVTTFEKRNAGGAHLTLLNWYSPWVNPSTGAAYQFPTPAFEEVRRHHVTPLLSWSSRGISNVDVAAGRWDAFIRSWASAAKSWRHPFFLRFDREMNGSWVTWGVGNNGNTAADFVAAWRHVHDIFTAVGATNVRWVWCPNVDPHHRFTDIGLLYPGDAYVDWTCLDGYNGDDPWTSFAKLFASSYRRLLQVAPSKPVMVGEVGSTETGGSKARWIRNMFAALPRRFPHIRGFLWFDQYLSGPGGHSDWPIETSAGSSHAFAKGLRKNGLVRVHRRGRLRHG
jgi:hypothetical protein